MQATKTIPGRREKRKQEIRARIENAAYVLFKRHGIDETSIEQICELADVARRTFYGHYPNKQALLQALSRSRVFGTADDMLHDIIDRHASTRDRMCAMIDYMAATIGTYKDIDRQLILVVQGTSDDRTQLHEVSASLQDHFAQFFRIGQKNGDTNTEFSPELLAEMVVGTLNTLLSKWALDTDYPIFDKLEEARALFARIVCSDREVSGG